MSGSGLVADNGRPEIVVRNFEFAPDASIPALWCGGEPYFTALMNALSCMFPAGERFFIRSVRRVEGLVKDPALRRDVRLFCAQEALHGSKYERLNSWIGNCGYPVSGVIRKLELSLVRMAAFYGPSVNLSRTVAFEHITSVLSQALLENTKVLEQFHPAVRPLAVWHALEEIEHKAVAFDVLQAVQPCYPLRLFGFVLAVIELTFFTCAIWFWFLAFRKELVCFGSLSRLLMLGFGSGFVWKVLKGLFAYVAPSFHPWKTDDRALIAKYAEMISGRFRPVGNADGF